ncbi:MAG: hypothetical protein AAFQ62_06295 [Pseudomonadota bacterium]
MRVTVRSDEADERLIAALKAAVPMNKAAEAAGYARASVYRWMRDEQNHPGFSEKIEEAREIARMWILDDALEAAHKRATEGWLEPVFYEGEVCGYKRRFSDTLLLALLKRHDRGFIDRMALEGGDGGPIQVVVNKGGAAARTDSETGPRLVHSKT